MNFGQLREDRDFYTEKLGDIVRQLDFAGIAIIWIFRNGNGTEMIGIAYSNFLLWPMVFLVSSLGADLLHYVWASAASDVLVYRYDKKKTQDTTDIRFDSKVPVITRILFWAKSLLTVVAFALLLYYIGTQLLSANEWSCFSRAIY
jgi:hypothetical protein